MITEELERDNVQDTLETVDGGRDDDGLVSGSTEHEAWDSFGISLESWVVLGADDDGSTFPGGDLSESGLDLFEMGIAGHDDDDWHVLVDQGKRTVLEFTSKNTLRVHIADFLNLQRSLEASGILISSTHDEQTLGDLESLLGHVLKSTVILQDLGDICGKGMKTSDDLVSPLTEGDAILGELDGHHDECDVLGSISLGTSNTDFGSGIDMDTAVSLTRDGTTDGIDDTDAKSSSIQAIPHSQDGIGSLSTLTDKDANVVSEDGRLSIEEVARQFNGDGDLGEFFKDGTGSDARVVRGSACYKDDTATTSDDGEVGLEPTKGDLVVVKVDSSSHRVDDGFGLLVDFLLHKVVKLALHDLGQLNLERLDDSLLFSSSATRGSSIRAQAMDMQLSLCDMSNIIVLEVQDPLGVLDDSTGIGSDEEFDGLG